MKDYDKEVLEIVKQRLRDVIKDATWENLKQRIETELMMIYNIRMELKARQEKELE